MNASTPPPLDPRVAFAAERTLLAWIRTGLALMGLGFVAARFGFFLREISLVTANSAPPLTRGSTSFWGVVLVAAGAAINVWASVRYGRILTSLARGTFVPAARGPTLFGLGTALGGVVLVALLLRAIL